MVGLIGLVFYVLGVFGDVVYMCILLFVVLIVVLVFDFMDDDFSWFRIGVLIGIILVLGLYFYLMYKKNKKEMMEFD